MAFDASKLVSGFAKAAAKAANTVKKDIDGKTGVPQENQLPEYQTLANMGNQWALQRMRPDSVKMRENTMKMQSDIASRNASNGLSEMGEYDPDKVDDHIADMKKLQEDREQWANEYNNNPMRTQRGANIARASGNWGTDLTVDPDKLTYKDDSGWNREFGEYERRFTDMKGNAHTTPSQMMGLTTQQLTAPEYRAVYEDLFHEWDDQGRSPDDAVSKNFTHDVMDPTIIDDGADPRSRQGQFMTGPEYMEYRKRGLPGRPVEEIDPSPNAIYNKQTEAENWGFVPYLVDDEALNEYRIGSEQKYVSDVFDNIANGRRFLTDYKLKYNGEEYSGKEFEKAASRWMRENEGTSGDVVFEDPGDPNAVPRSLYITDVDEDGNPTILGYATKPPIATYKLENGEIVVDFGGDESENWYFEGEDDYANNCKLGYTLNGEPTVMWEVGVEPLTMPDGRQVRADIADEMWKSISDPDAHPEIEHDYGFLGIGNPNVEYPSDGFLPWIVDMTLSSAPYFWLPSSVALAGGNAGMSSMGFRRGRNIQDDTYNLVSEDPTLDQVLTGTAASAAMPMTERIWGPFGQMAMGGSPTGRLVGGIVNKWGKNRAAGMAADDAADYLDNLVAKQNSPLARYLIGASDEGNEELFGNITEELQANGFKDWNANDVPLTDGDGNVIPGSVSHDSQRHNIKEDETSALDRAYNFILGNGGLPLAWFGGATLGLGLGGASVPSYRAENEYRYKPWLDDRIAERKAFGYNTIIPSDPKDYDPEWKNKELKAKVNAGSLEDYVARLREAQEVIDAYRPYSRDIVDKMADRYTSILNR